MKKGFTLVEIIAIIVLLGIIGIIAIPAINNTLNNQKQTLYESQIDDIEKAAERWGFDNTNKLPINEGEIIYITIEELKLQSYLNKELIDPRDEQPFPNELKIRIVKKGDGYYYKVENK